MKKLLVLTGANGAGKTTVSMWLEYEGLAVRLKPFTTRARRSPTDDEYHFMDPDAVSGAAVAWKMARGSDIYGMLQSEIDKLGDGKLGVTVFEPEQIQVLHDYRSNSVGVEIIVLSLDTISDTDELRRRIVSNREGGLTAEQFQGVRDILQQQDICLSGDLRKIQAATRAICEILTGRGGVVSGATLRDLIVAGSLLKDADLGQIQSASYDLRVGDEVWCQGHFVDLDANSDRFSIPPYSYAIVKAKETASVPSFLAGSFDIKVSHFLSGMILSNGPQVDPGYRGDLFCMLFNGSSVPQHLRRNDHFSTIQFTTIIRNSPRYAGPYSFRDRLRNTMPTEAAGGPGGAIFTRIDNGIKDLRREFRFFQSTMISLLAVAAATTLVAAGFAFSATMTAFSEGQEAVKAANQAGMASERLSAAASDLKQARARAPLTDTVRSHDSAEHSAAKMNANKTSY